MSTLNVEAISHPTSGSLVTINGTAPSNRNLVINGKLQVDQYDTSVTADGFFVDRWKYSADAGSKATVQKDNESPVDFQKSIFVTSSSAYTVPNGETYKIRHVIEGYNTAHLEFGTANAKTITLSFYVRSSLTGTFGGALRNSGASRSYPFTYSISTANTWERKTVTIAGDTIGTWNTGNGVGIEIDFGLAVGSTYSGTAGSWSSNNYVSATGATSVLATNAATWYLTGVQLEVGSVATPFEHRSYGDELARCQRYYWQTPTGVNGSPEFTGFANTTTNSIILTRNPVPMRAAPSFSSSGGWQIIDGTGHSISSFAYQQATELSGRLDCTASGLTTSTPNILRTTSTTSTIQFSAEL